MLTHRHKKGLPNQEAPLFLYYLYLQSNYQATRTLTAAEGIFEAMS